MPIRWFSDRSVRSKVHVAVALVALVALAVGVQSLIRLRDADHQMNGVTGTIIPRIRAIGALRGAQAQLNDAAANQIAGQFTKDADATAKAQTLFADAEADMNAAITKLQGSVTSDADRARVAAVVEAWQVYDSSVRVNQYGLDALAGITPVGQDETGDLVASMTAAFDELAANADAEARTAAAEGHDSYRAAVLQIAILLLVGLLCGMTIAELVARTIRQRVRDVGTALRAMAEGDLTGTVPVTSRDELGVMSGDMNEALSGVRAAVTAMAGSADTLADQAARLSSSSDQILSSARQTSQQARGAAATADLVSANVSTVASASQQMSGSIEEIARNASDGASVAATAAERAVATNAVISKLGDSSAEIGDVIKTITSIAEQTNLLALNATIEAARAGESGKGFAVVAGEVKDLAQETARATADISERVRAIQTDTRGAVEAIAEITTIIGKINEYQSSIAAAVDQQTATTNEMNRSVSEAAGGSSDIAGNIAQAAQAAEQTTTAVAQNREAAASLAAISAEFRELVGRFRY
ncbi:methyl-accepting chemotaxis protein [Actinoplanes sp. NBC_00393]|uniref:methyl-accepting chemotaxis protein n=1 Tax=Actinoplanes sp. NBC_00393 TaxID=2975953 RepID=UPI002E216571